LNILRKKIAFGGNGGETVVGLGKIAISTNHSISDVYLVESLDYNLLCVGLQFVVRVTTL
jgi:hypothetical protein